MNPKTPVEIKLHDALVAILRDIPFGLECKDMHHYKRDRHASNELCPVVERLNKAINAARDLIS